MNRKENAVKATKIDIYYKGDLRKSKICSTEEEYTWLMEWYGFDPDNNKIFHAKRKDKPELEYFYPRTAMYGKDEDDKKLEIEVIIVNKNWGI